MQVLNCKRSEFQVKWIKTQGCQERLLHHLQVSCTLKLPGDQYSFQSRIQGIKGMVSR